MDNAPFSSSPPEHAQKPIATVLVVDDTPDNLVLVSELLGDSYRVKVANSGARALKAAQTDPVPDLVLLDLTLPVKDGQHICHEVRRESEVPIIVLTSRTTEIDEVMAMTLGADDFVPKPYSARVLVARINALLRRTAAAGERSTLVHKGLELDLARSMVTNTQTGTSTELTKNELRILSLLLSRAGKIVSRSAIIKHFEKRGVPRDLSAKVHANELAVSGGGQVGV